MRYFFIRFSAIMHYISALAVFRELIRSIRLSELVGGQRREGTTPKTSREGTIPSRPIVPLIELTAKRSICGSGSLGCPVEVILKIVWSG